MVLTPVPENVFVGAVNDTTGFELYPEPNEFKFTSLIPPRTFTVIAPVLNEGYALGTEPINFKAAVPFSTVPTL